MIQSHKSWIAGAFGVAAVALAGCSQKVSAPPPAIQSTAPLAIPVHRQTESHMVPLALNGRVAPIERARLDAFVADLAGSRPDALHATVSGAHSEAQLRTVTRMLVRDGIAPNKITVVPTSGRRMDEVTISVDRYVAAAPRCNPWGSIYTASSKKNANPTPTDFGCTDLENLGAMVADPHDLVKGESSPYADGTTAATAVSHYRLDEIPPLPNPGGFSVNTSGTGTASPPAGPSASTGGL